MRQIRSRVRRWFRRTPTSKSQVAFFSSIDRAFESISSPHCLHLTATINSGQAHGWILDLSRADCCCFLGTRRSFCDISFIWFQSELSGKVFHGSMAFVQQKSPGCIGMTRVPAHLLQDGFPDNISKLPRSRPVF